DIPHSAGSARRADLARPAQVPEDTRSRCAFAGQIGVRPDGAGRPSTGSFMNESENEFAALMARVCHDDDEALAALISLYEPAIRRAADVLLGKPLRSSIDPTDLVQSVHLEMILGLRRRKLVIVSPGHLRSLAVTLLRHKYIEHWRRHRCQ